MSGERVILHLDMDAFYAAVEVREDPSLRGKPLIIGHRGRRGVVSTCSYEARRYGVRSAMPSVTAQRLCPDAIWRPGRMRLYVEISRGIRELLREAAPLVEPLSIDEAFLDLTGLASDLEDGAVRGADIKRRIADEHGLGASVGVSFNKFLAKIASDLEKPDGLVVFSPADVERRLWPMPVRRLWGVGPRTAERLQRGGIRCVADLLRTDESALAESVGQVSASHLRALARGEDERPVRSRREAKSISEERTYGEDLTSPDDIDRALLARSEGVARELRRDGVTARTVHIKVRTGDYTTWTRSLTLSHPTRYAEAIVGAAREMLRDRIRLRGRGVRLLGVGVSGLERTGSGQGRLFTTDDEERSSRLARASDAVRDRLGEAAITRARLLRRRRRGGVDEEEASSLPSVD